MRSAFLAIVLAYVLYIGFSYPFVAMLAYVWIDIAKPQSLAYSIINTLPVSMIAAAITLIAFVIKGEKKKIDGAPMLLLLGFFAIWVTFTTFVADPGIEPWTKWDWAFKVIVFSIFIPFVIRSRVQVEAFLLTMVFSIATISFSGGVKAALGGGGYGVLAVMGGASNSGLSESSTLAAICVMQLPIMHYLYKHTVIFPNSKAFKILIGGTALVNMCAVVGSGARTGLVTMGVLLALYGLRTRRKVAFGVAMLVALAVVSQLDLSKTAWGTRMSSINTYQQDASALGRVAVWKWTAEFATTHPFGGGFDAFRLNRIALANEEGIQYFPPGQYRGKAFHNVFFEVMGEQGFVGLAVYLAILAMTLWKLSWLRRRSRGDPALAWLGDLSMKFSDALVVLLVGGMFIGIAYQPFIFYMVALTLSISGLLPMALQGRQVVVHHAK